MSVFWGFVLFIFSGMYMYLVQHSHVLIMLLGLEVMMLGLFGLMGGVFFLSGEEMLLMMFLVFSVCEGGIGLCLLVFFVRSYSNDYLGSVSVLWC